jgi:protein phosphatase 2C family protein 2/3
MGKAMQEICEELMDRCLAPDSEIGGVGCDNVSSAALLPLFCCLLTRAAQMTVCVVALLGGRTKEEWYAWVKERVDNKVGWETPEDIAPVFKQAAAGSAGAGAGPGGLSLGRLGALGGGSVLSALAGGMAQGEEDDERAGALRLPGGLAGA